MFVCCYVKDAPCRERSRSPGNSRSAARIDHAATAADRPREISLPAALTTPPGFHARTPGKVVPPPSPRSCAERMAKPQNKSRLNAAGLIAAFEGEMSEREVADWHVSLSDISLIASHQERRLTPPNVVFRRQVTAAVIEMLSCRRHCGRDYAFPRSAAMTAAAHDRLSYNRALRSHAAHLRARLSPHEAAMRRCRFPDPLISPARVKLATIVWLAEHPNLPASPRGASVVLVLSLQNEKHPRRRGRYHAAEPRAARHAVSSARSSRSIPGIVSAGRAPAAITYRPRATTFSCSSGDTFPQDVLELQSYFQPAKPGQAVQAVPGAGLNVPLYLLGSSDFSARLAAELGLPFAFASHFAPEYLEVALALYRREFQPSAALDGRMS